MNQISVLLALALVEAVAAASKPCEPEVTFHPTSPQPVAVVAADFDGDGDADVATASEYAYVISVLTNLGDGTFGPAQNVATLQRPEAMVTADVDGDGDPDLVTIERSLFTPTMVVIYENDGLGGFSSSQGYEPPQPFLAASVLVATDFNVDGQTDLVVGGIDGTYRLENVNGVFQHAGSLEIGPISELDAGDLDGDGDEDLTASSLSGVLVLGLDDAEYQPPILLQIPTGATALADFDGDGIADISVYSYATSSVWVYDFDSQGNTVPKRVIAVGANAHDTLAADINGDDIADVASISIIDDALWLSLSQGGSSSSYHDPIELPSTFNPMAIAAGDLLGDGTTGLVVAYVGYVVGSYRSLCVSDPCAYDCGDENGVIGTLDLLMLLASWGDVAPCDRDGGGVGTSDLLSLLATWGPCPP